MTKHYDIKTTRYRTSALFECLICGLRWEGLKDARQKSYAHARQTGHKVHGEIGTSYHYGREGDKE
jgi:hypothetical protein